MNKQLKFRAIDQFSDKFIFGQGFFVDSDNNQGYLTNGVDRHHCVKKDTVNQWIKLKDSQGVDLYENDIIEFTYLEIYKVIGLINLNEWGQSEIQSLKVFSKVSDAKKDFKDGLNFHIENAVKGIIIGDIYHNGEFI